MADPLAQIEDLIDDGYALYLHRDHTGACSAVLSRGWLFKQKVRVRLDRQQFERAKDLLGETSRHRVKLARE